MAWKTPRIVEIAVGMEINSYACADSRPLTAAAQPRRRHEGRRSWEPPPAAAFPSGIPTPKRVVARAPATRKVVPPHPGVAGGERRRRALVPDQRLPRPSPADPGPAILHPRQGLRSSPIEGDHPHRRRCRRHRRAPAPARTPGLHAPRQRARARRAEGQSDLRRAGAETACAARQCRSAAFRAAPCRRQRAAGSRSSCSTCRARSRSTSKTGDARRRSWRASRATPSASRCAQAGSGCSTSPAVRGMTDALKQRLAGASVVLFDGTLWRDDEMVAARPRPQDGPAHGPHERQRPRRHDRGLPRHPGEAQDPHAHQQLQPDPARRFGRSAPALAKEGWEVAYDGMEVSP